MSETALVLIILAPLAIVWIVKEYAFNVLPASHWLNRTLNQPDKKGGGEGGWFDGDGGDGGGGGD